MRKYLCTISIMLVLVLTLGAFSAAATGNTNYISPTGFTYTLSEVGATITGYVGSDMTKTLYIPSYVSGNKVIAIGEDAFTWQQEIETVIFSDDSAVQYIETNAFAACTSLKTITLPSTLTEIGNGAFQHCAFEGIELPYNLSAVGNYAFRNCTSLKSAYLPQTTEIIGEAAFIGCTSLETVSISGKITEIADETFYDCSSLISINIPETVAEIGKRAFYNCSSLTDLYIPENVTYIEVSAFECCKQFTAYSEAESYTAGYFKNNNLPFVPLKAPEIMLVGATKILIKAEDGFEYSIGDGNWQTEPLFTGRKEGRQCFVYVVPVGKRDYAEYWRYTAVIMDGQDDVSQQPTAQHLIELRANLLINSKNMGNDYNADGRIDILDFVKLKKILSE